MAMQRRKPAGIHPQWRIPEPLHSQIILAAMVASAALPLLMLASLLPRPLVLPVLCLIAIVAASIMSFIAWRCGTVRESRDVTAWDIAGALAFVACASAILSNPEQVILLTM
jgi:hypothetical protein